MPPPPVRLEVVPEDAVEPAMVTVVGELGNLADELAALRRKADALEHHVARREAGRDDRHCRSILQQVFVSTAESTRAEFDAALARAQAAADSRIATARAEANAISGHCALRSGPAGSRVPPPAYESVPVHAPSEVGTPREPMDEEREREQHLTLVGGGLPGTRVARSVRDERRPPSLGDPGGPSGDEASIGAPSRPVPGPGPAITTAAWGPGEPVVTLAPGLDHFAQFWVGDRSTAIGPRFKLAFVDVVLPVVAAGIVLVIILSWVG